jgi:uncharacterized protein YbaR (Trm112 family)
MDTPKLSPDLLDILRCPVGVHMEGDDPGKLTVARDGWWLVCEASQHKYPVRDGIPDMIPESGAAWAETDVDALPVPPPPLD